MSDQEKCKFEVFFCLWKSHLKILFKIHTEIAPTQKWGWERKCSRFKTFARRLPQSWIKWNVIFRCVFQCTIYTLKVRFSKEILKSVYVFLSHTMPTLRVGKPWFSLYKNKKKRKELSHLHTFASVVSFLKLVIRQTGETEIRWRRHRLLATEVELLTNIRCEIKV